MDNPSAKLEQHFVAFIDILGFASMVEADCEGPSGRETYLPRLREVTTRALKFRESLTGLQLVQFSDSIVVSHPYDPNFFSPFLGSIAKFQWDLFDNQILTRGGIAYGKHYHQQELMFSQGLVEAYRIERGIARFPRVALSNDLLELVAPGAQIKEVAHLVFEDDGVAFVDYFAQCTQLGGVPKALKRVSDATETEDPSVHEKLRWLGAYAAFRTGDQTLVTNKRFRIEAI